MDIAEIMGQRSRCVRAQIGAVIVSDRNRIVATGYNGPAATWPYDGPCSNWCPRAQGKTTLDSSYDECPAIHAEENAIAYVDRSAVEGGWIFVNGAMCMKCAKLVSNSGIVGAGMIIREQDTHRNPEAVSRYLGLCGIRVRIHQRD